MSASISRWRIRYLRQELEPAGPTSTCPVPPVVDGHFVAREPTLRDPDDVARARTRWPRFVGCWVDFLHGRFGGEINEGGREVGEPIWRESPGWFPWEGAFCRMGSVHVASRRHKELHAPGLRCSG